MASLGRSMVALTGARLVSVAAVFLAGVAAARLLTPAAVGVAGVGLTVGWAVAIVANGGLNISAIYYLGREDTPAGRSTVAHRVLGLMLGCVVVGVLVTAIVAPIVGLVVLGRQEPAMFAMAAGMALGTIGYEVAGSLLLGLARRTDYVVSDLVRSLATLGGTVLVLALLSRTAEGYVGATALGVLVPAAYALAVVRRETGSLRPRFDRDFARRALRMGLAGQTGNILSFLNLRLDLLLVPALVRLDQAGVYFVATRVAEVVGQASTASASLLFPHVAAQPDPGATRATERASRLTLLATLAPAVVLAVVATPVLVLFFGSAYRSGTVALLLLLVGMVPMAWSRVIAADLKGRGRAGLVSIGTGIGAVVTVVADLTMIPVWGIAGAAGASILAYGASAAMLLGCYRRVTGGSILALVPRASDVRGLVRVGLARVRGVRRTGGAGVGGSGAGAGGGSGPGGGGGAGGSEGTDVEVA